MAIKSISAFTIQPGRRDEFVDLFERLVDQHLEMVHSAGCSDVKLYRVFDDPHRAVEIADWESVGDRDAAQTKEEWSVFAPLFELVAVPPATTLVEPLR
jgi:quinol monooxygenase YgiN